MGKILLLVIVVVLCCTKIVSIQDNSAIVIASPLMPPFDSAVAECIRDETAPPLRCAMNFTMKLGAVTVIHRIGFCPRCEDAAIAIASWGKPDDAVRRRITELSHMR